jgi:thiosulfate reductase cytochrome b subunit
MRKNKLLKIVNPIMFILIVLQIVTAILMEVTGDSTFREIHEINGFLLVIFIIVHLSLNWSWIKANFLKSRKS